MNLNEKLTELRKAKGLTQQEVAEALNVSRQTISRWEVGATEPSLDNLAFLSRLYGVPLDDFVQKETIEPAKVPEVVSTDVSSDVPADASTAASTRVGKLHTIPVCLFLAILVIVLGVGILIGASLRQKSEKAVYVYKSDPGERITVNGWTAQEVEAPPSPGNNEVEILSPYKVIATYDPASGLLEMMPDNIPEEIKKDFDRRISK